MWKRATALGDTANVYRILKIWLEKRALKGYNTELYSSRVERR